MGLLPTGKRSAIERPYLHGPTARKGPPVDVFAITRKRETALVLKPIKPPKPQMATISWKSGHGTCCRATHNPGRHRPAVAACVRRKGPAIKGGGGFQRRQSWGSKNQPGWPIAPHLSCRARVRGIVRTPPPGRRFSFLPPRRSEIQPSASPKGPRFRGRIDRAIHARGPYASAWPRKTRPDQSPGPPSSSVTSVAVRGPCRHALWSA